MRAVHQVTHFIDNRGQAISLVGFSTRQRSFSGKLDQVEGII
jgi:hypothetical protein